MGSYRKYLTKDQIKEKRAITYNAEGVFKWETTVIQFLARALGMCDKCEKLFKYPRIYAQNTAYTEDHMNYVCLCSGCRDENDKYWEEMWEEHGFNSW